MWECSKSVPRRLSDSRFITRYFVGDGIDIGSGPDGLAQYRELFPLMTTCQQWDIEDGDAQLMEGLSPSIFDFVHSSHCLEHLCDPHSAIRRWYELLKPGGHLVILVPDFDLYEHGSFPSRMNEDHKCAFTLRESDYPEVVPVFELLSLLPYDSTVLKVELLDSTYRPALDFMDQTLTPIGECAIEFIVRKGASRNG